MAWRGRERWHGRHLDGLFNTGRAMRASPKKGMQPWPISHFYFTHGNCRFNWLAWLLSWYRVKGEHEPKVDLWTYSEVQGWDLARCFFFLGKNGNAMSPIFATEYLASHFTHRRLNDGNDSGEISMFCRTPTPNACSRWYLLYCRSRTVILPPLSLFWAVWVLPLYVNHDVLLHESCVFE